jgi:M6 family metalloprotease-like protein
MKKVTIYIFIQLVFHVTSYAQISYPGSFEDAHLLPLKSATIGTKYTPNGDEFTPKGDFKVLIICAGFGNPYDNDPVSGWSTGVNTFPDWVNANTTFYQNNTSFNSPATVNDKSNVSRFYHEMSNGTFRMTADVYPTRVNINATGAATWADLNKKVIEKMKADNPSFNWSAYDNRKNSPGFLSDNSTSSPDLKPDFVVIVYRYNRDGSNQPVVGMQDWTGSRGGYAALDGLSGVSFNGYTFGLYSGYTHCLGTSSMYGLFIHELAHNIFDCPHYANANGVVGDYFYNQIGGWGMMNLGSGPFGCANGWERWYLGWIDLKANGINSDVKSPADLPANGEFTLRDFITTGDVVRIEIRNGSRPTQHLWLENHQGKSIYDDRGWINDNGCGSNVLPPSARGLVGYIEHIANDRSTTYIFSSGANGIKPIHSKGNYDYSFSGSAQTSCLLWSNPIYNILEGVANPIAGQDRLEGIRLDYDSNNSISWNSDANNLRGGGGPNENYWVAQRNGNMTYDFMGSDINFSVGQKLGMATNPSLSNSPMYIESSKSMESYYLNGISVTIYSQAANGDIKVRIAYNDIDINSNLRWSGNIVLPDITSTASPDLSLSSNCALTINKSGTSNTHIKTTSGDFINNTTFTSEQNSFFKMQANSTVYLDGNSTFTLKSGSTLEINDGAKFIVKNGSKLNVESGATILIKGSGGIIIKCTGTLCVNSGATLNLQDFPSCIQLLEAGSLNSACLTNLSSVKTGNGSVKSYTSNLTLSGTTISSDSYNSGISIISSNVTIQGTGTDVIYDATNDITINGTFEVPLGATFEAKICSASCSN